MLFIFVSAAASFALDRQGRAVQAACSLYDLAISTVVVPRFVRGAIWSLSEEDAEQWQAERAIHGPCARPSPSPPSSLADSECSSTGRDISSFRIPDRSLRSRDPKRRPPLVLVLGRRRPSASAEPPSSRTAHGLTSPKHRGSMDHFDSSRGSSGRRRRSGSSDSANGALVRRASFQPRMVRIASGQELAGPQMGVPRISDSAASCMSDDTNLDASGAAVHSAPEEPLSPAGSWASSASSSFSTITSKVDSLLRPLVPSSPTLDSLKRWPSAPVAWRMPWQPGSSGGEGTSSGGGGGTDQQRSSIDGHGASRHYTHGGIAAHMTGRDALERLACAARLQARSTMPSAGPGHVAIGSGAASASAFYKSTGDAGAGAAPGASAVASVGLDGDCPQSVREAVTDEHLLQLGALLGEGASQDALRALGLPGAMDDPRSLYGLQEEGASGWEAAVDESRPGLSLQAWRMHLRGGLYVYRSVVRIEGLSPRDVRPFHLDDQARQVSQEKFIACLPSDCVEDLNAIRVEKKRQMHVC